MKNIIFDLGGVVFNWDPQALRERSFSNPEDRARVKEHFMEHPQWEEMDRGIKDLDLILEEAAHRSGVAKKALRNMLDKVPEVLTVKEGTRHIIKKLRKKGFKLFVLSNMPRETWIYLNENFPLFELFDGKVASCDIGMIKPDAGIYNYILDKFNLIPGESLFIDDLAKNVRAAEELGIHGIIFQSPKQLEDKLKDLGCL